MKTKILILWILVCLPTLCLAQVTLTQAEQDKLAKGSMITKTNWKEGFIWPEVTVITYLEHSPKQNLNVFVDFEYHKKFVPDMLESKVVKRISEAQAHVYFEMEMPWPVNKTSHTTNNIVTDNKDGSYTLKWNLVKGKMLKSTDGYIKFSPSNGKTLFTYVSQIVPDSSFAGIFKNRVEEDVNKTVKVIAKHLKKTLDKNMSND